MLFYSLARDELLQAFREWAPTAAAVIREVQLMGFWAKVRFISPRPHNQVRLDLERMRRLTGAEFVLQSGERSSYWGLTEAEYGEWRRRFGTN